MVRICMLIFVIISCFQGKAQTHDTLNCEKTFKFYDELLGEELIVIWETPPSIKECSNETVSCLRNKTKQIGLQSIVVNMIIDTTGVPVCFKFNQELEPETEKLIIRKLKQVRFNPALQKGRGTESIYTLRI